MDHNFISNTKKLVDQIRTNTKEDVFVFHSTLDINNPIFQIDSTDPKIFEFLIDEAKESETLNLIIQTRGGCYPSAIDIHNLLREKYKTIKVIIPNTAMSCGSFLSITSDELFLHQNCNMGAFDPQVKFSGNAYTTGLYSLLKILGINNKQTTPNPDNYPAAIAKVITDGHTNYYLIEDYITKALTNCKLVNNGDIQGILDRFYKDDHGDYGHHGKRIDFGYFKKYVPTVSPMALHPEYSALIDLFIQCEILLNQYQLGRIYILNNKFYHR